MRCRSTARLMKQVTLKVRIVEVDRSKLFQFGFNFFSQGGSTICEHNYIAIPIQRRPTLPRRRASAAALWPSPIRSTFCCSAQSSTSVRRSKTWKTSRCCRSSPSPAITSLVRVRKANFLAGGEFPFPVVQGGGGAANQTSITVAFRPYGVRLEFTPYVNARWLHRAESRA